MKKELMILILSALSICATAQEFKFGPAVGMNISKLSYTENKSGFQIGVTGECLLSSKNNGFLLETSIMLASQGWKAYCYQFEDNNNEKSLELSTIINEATPYSIYIPIHLGYQFKISEIFKLQTSVGPYVNYGLFGKQKQRSLKNGNLIDSYKYLIYGIGGDERFEYGLGIKVQLQYKDKYQVFCEWNKGLTNSRKNIDSKKTCACVGVSVFL